ncbi:hypothetical protein L873DRAFT_1799084, partial [Choiromyces venosus 120613-1]
QWCIVHLSMSVHNTSLHMRRRSRRGRSEVILDKGIDHMPPCQDSYAIGGEYAGASGKALMYRTENLAKFSFV